MTDATTKPSETVYVSALRRAALPGEIHGKLLKFDPQTKEWNTLLELDDALVGDNPRGWSRGFRGVVHCPETDTLWVTGFQALFNISRDGRILERFQHPSFQHLHALSLYDGKLFITSTALNLVVVFCLRRRAVEYWYWLTLDESGAEQLMLNHPLATCRPIHHLNAIQVNDRGIFLSGALSRSVLLVTDGQVKSIHPSPLGSHDFVLQDDLMCILDTEADAILFHQQNKVVWTHKLQSDDNCTPSLPHAIARQNFLRGICLLSGDRVAAGISPLAVVCCDNDSGQHLWTSRFTNDVTWMISGLNAVG